MAVLLGLFSLCSLVLAIVGLYGLIAYSGVSTTDALTFALSPVLFLVLAAVASWIPARRAGRVDPCETLRASSAGRF